MPPALIGGAIKRPLHPVVRGKDKHMDWDVFKLVAPPAIGAAVVTALLCSTGHTRQSRELKRKSIGFLRSEQDEMHAGPRRRLWQSFLRVFRAKTS